MTSRPIALPAALIAVAALLTAPPAAFADASPADASSPVAADNSPPPGVHPVVGALLTGTIGKDDVIVTNPDGSTATGPLGSRYELYGGAEFPLTAGGLRLRLTAGVHIGTLSGGERFTRFPLEASLWYPISDDLRVGAGARYPMRMRFGGAGQDTSDSLSATPGVMVLADYRVAKYFWLDARYVVERYSRAAGGQVDASHFGLGASAMY